MFIESGKYVRLFENFYYFIYQNDKLMGSVIITALVCAVIASYCPLPAPTLSYASISTAPVQSIGGVTYFTCNFGYITSGGEAECCVLWEREDRIGSPFPNHL